MPFYQLRGVGGFTFYSDTPRFYRLKIIELESAPHLVVQTCFPSFFRSPQNWGRFDFHFNFCICSAESCGFSVSNPWDPEPEEGE